MYLTQHNGRGEASSTLASNFFIKHQACFYSYYGFKVVLNDGKTHKKGFDVPETIFYISE